MIDDPYLLSKAAELLEWPKVLARLSDHAMSAPGRAACAHVDFAEDAEAARRALRTTGEAVSLIGEGRVPPLTDVHALIEELERARLGATLQGGELILVGDVLRASRRARDVLTDDWERSPLLAESATHLYADERLELDIFAAIDPSGEVNDAASPELVNLRRRQRALHKQILERMAELAKVPEWAGYLQDDFYTIRNGRYVLLVKIEKQGKIEGIVHDISGSGQSLYIEPKEITQLNNVLRSTEVAIAQEITRILRAFSARVSAQADALAETADTLIDLDLAFARGRYAIAVEGREPEMSVDGRMALRRLRHPLLVGKAGVDVVANDVEMAGSAGCMIVTGPNTGGKTVLLKAVGLAALMARAGLHPPVGYESVVPFFPRVFAMIGDRQSIEAGLSTFAGHIASLKEITDLAGAGSLALLDEVGEGTDPRQGVALSMAALEHLAAAGARVIATTHFSELAALATRREGFLNASMEFDPVRMLPTYRLRLGVPGRSGAFDVAARMGLSERIVARARELYEGAASELHDIMERLDRTHQEWRAKSDEAERERRHAADLVDKQRELLRELEAKKRERAGKEMADLESLYARAREEIRRVMAQLREKPSPAGIEKTREAMREIMEEARAKTPPPMEKEPRPATHARIENWYDMAEGDAVYVSAVKAVGRLESLPDAKGQTRVLVGGARLTVSASELFHPAVEPAERGVRVTIEKPVLGSESATTKDRTLDLRGQYADDALDRAAEFLDLAWRSRWTRVTIVHGHGTGTLKREVREWLRGSPYAIDWRPGERGEGGDGATVVDFRREDA